MKPSSVNQHVKRPVIIETYKSQNKADIFMYTHSHFAAFIM